MAMTNDDTGSRRSSLSGRLRARVAVLALVPLLALGGCGGSDGIEFNGAIFEAVGLGNTGPKKEPKLSDRPGIVLPPSLEKLPEPGTTAAAAPAQDPSWPVDVEQRKVADVSRRKREHDAFCAKALQEAKVRGDTTPIRGPDGICNASALRSLFGTSGTLIEGSSNKAQ